VPNQAILVPLRRCRYEMDDVVALNGCMTASAVTISVTSKWWWQRGPNRRPAVD
jgi:hypothetical protein